MCCTFFSSLLLSSAKYIDKHLSCVDGGVYEVMIGMGRGDIHLRKEFTLIYICFFNLIILTFSYFVRFERVEK